MPQFTVNTQRFDPYKNFKFRLKWDGRYVAGVSKVSSLKRTTEVVKHREGGDPSSSRKSPGRSEFEAVTLERGVTHDLEFERWANKVWDFGAGLGVETSLPAPAVKFHTLLAHFSNSASCVTPRSSVMASYSVRPGDLRLLLGSAPSRCLTTSVVRLSPPILLTPAT